MATVAEFLTDTLVLIGVHDPGETPASSDLDSAFRAFNRLIGSWSAAGLPIYKVTRDTHAMNGSASFTIGSGATINVARPLKIISASVNVSGAVEGVEIVTAEQWAAIADKSRAGLFAKALFYDGGYPTGTIWLTPTPATGGTLELYSVKALSTFSATSDSIDLPPGYEQALQAALAVVIAPGFGRTVPQEIAATANEAKQSIASMNAATLGIAPPAQAPTE
jgi:hypothetical protein